MKKLKLFGFTLAFVLMITVNTPVFTYALEYPDFENGNKVFSFDFIDFIEDQTGGASLAPSLKHINSTSLTFFVSNKGTAYVSYTASVKSSGGIKARIYIEKRTLGLLWKKVSLGVSGNEWSDSTGKKFLSGTHTVKLSENGEYRAVAEIEAEKETAKIQSVYSYDKNILRGDVNSDKKLTASDARTILRYSANIVKMPSDKRNTCDVNNDGIITASDARLTLRMSAMLI